MKLSTKIRIFIIFLTTAFVGLCMCILPLCGEYISDVAVQKGFELSPIAVCLAGIVLCVPCVVILVMSMSLARAVERDEVFRASTAKTLKCISVLFFTDCIAFLCGIIVLLCLGELLISPLLTLIDLVGFAIGTLLSVLSGYIRRASELQEEVDATL